jgi:hypothetical protein
MTTVPAEHSGRCLCGGVRYEITLDTPTGLAIEKHIFIRDKSDYYALTDDLPKSDGDG